MRGPTNYGFDLEDVKTIVRLTKPIVNRDVRTATGFRVLSHWHETHSHRTRPHYCLRCHRDVSIDPRVRVYQVVLYYPDLKSGGALLHACMDRSACDYRKAVRS